MICIFYCVCVVLTLALSSKAFSFYNVCYVSFLVNICFLPKMALTTLPSNPMNFTENQHGNTILEKLKQQKEQGRFCDVTLYIDGKKYKAHRNVLASCSPYFDSVLKMHKTVKEGLTITCQNPEVFHCLLNYMYTGSIVIDKNNVAELLRLSSHFLVAKLRNYCAEYLDRYLDISNCLSVREMAEKYNMPSLMKAATLFIQVNVSKVIFQEEILFIPLRKIEAFLSEKSWSVPHRMLLSLIARWVNQDVINRERNMKTLLTFVDWQSMDGNTITEHIDGEPLYSASERSLYFILQSLVENNLLFPKYQGVYQTLHDKFSQEEISDGTDKNCTVPESSMVVKSKLVLTRCRRYKNKVIGVRPGARLAALKAALAARRKKIIKIPNGRSAHEDDQGHHSCHLCAYMAHSLCLLEEHLAGAHSKDVTYKCGMCGYICQWNKDYLTHMKEHFQGPPFKCDSCKFTCDHVNALLAHRLKHTDGQSYQCNDCGYECSSRSDLMAHKQCHSSSRHSYKCDTCGKHFTFKSSLEQHLLTHGNDRPYLCDTCGFSTKYLSLLIAHKRIHSGDVFRCQYPQCKYTTLKKSQLETHARTHVDVRPHSCNICGRGFLEKSHLVRHERIHLEEKPFKCAQCNYASSRRDKLKEHCARHHAHNAHNAPNSHNAHNSHNAPYNHGEAHVDNNAVSKSPYKARPVRAFGSARTPDKICQNSSGFNTGSSSNSSLSSSTSLDRNSSQPVGGNGDLDLMMQHQINVATSAPPPGPLQQPTYPPFSETLHPPLEFHHHQLLNTRGVSKTELHSVHLPQAPTHHHMLPPPRSQHHQSSAAAVAAMMLDPRFHHANPASTYHTAPPPASMAAMVVPSGTPNQGITTQHHQSDYPCMPLF